VATSLQYTILTLKRIALTIRNVFQSFLNLQANVGKPFLLTSISFFLRIIYHILEKMGEGNARCKKSHLIVASHNERSIRLAAHLTKEFGLEQSDGKHGVSYAQVFGMSDYLSTPLGEGHLTYPNQRIKFLIVNFLLKSKVATTSTSPLRMDQWRASCHI